MRLSYNSSTPDARKGAEAGGIRANRMGFTNRLPVSDAYHYLRAMCTTQKRKRYAGPVTLLAAGCAGAARRFDCVTSVYAWPSWNDTRPAGLLLYYLAAQALPDSMPVMLRG